MEGAARWCFHIPMLSDPLEFIYDGAAGAPAASPIPGPAILPRYSFKSISSPEINHL